MSSKRVILCYPRRQIYHMHTEKQPIYLILTIKKTTLDLSRSES